MNSELKVIIFEQKKILQNLLKLLDEQYNLVLNKDVIALGKIAEDIEEEGKKLATIEIKRRNIASEEEFNNFIKNTDDEHITNVYNEMKELLTNLFFTNKMINVIKPSKSVNTYNAYGKVGR